MVGAIDFSWPRRGPATCYLPLAWEGRCQRQPRPLPPSSSPHCYRDVEDDRPQSRRCLKKKKKKKRSLLGSVVVGIAVGMRVNKGGGWLRRWLGWRTPPRPPQRPGPTNATVQTPQLATIDFSVRFPAWPQNSQWKCCARLVSTLSGCPIK